MSNIVPCISRKMLVALMSLFLLGSVTEAFSANLLELFLRNQRPSDDCSEYFAELWVTVDNGADWDVQSSNIAVSYNTAAMTAQNLGTAFEANSYLTDDNVSISQTPGPGFVRINLLKFPGATTTSGTMKIATIRWTITDKSNSDNLTFITGGPSTQLFDGATPLAFNCGTNLCFGVTNPTPPRVIGGPVITQQPVSVTTCVGSTVNFTVDGNGCNIAWQWQRLDGAVWTDLVGETSKTLSLVNVQANMDGNQYRVEATADEPPMATSNVVTLTVNSPAAFTTQPTNVAECEGSDADFSIAVTGTAPVAIQWQQFNGGTLMWDDLAGQNATTLTISNIQTSDNGNQYRAVITNVCNSTTSDVGVLTVWTAPVVNDDPNNKFICAGDNVTFSANANGNPLPTIQWQVDDGNGWMDIPGETASTYTINNVPANLNGFMYRAVFTNVCGSTNTAPATITVYELPMVTTQPMDVAICENNDVDFWVVSVSAIPQTYQWQVDNGGGFADIIGETSTTLTLTNVQAGSNGNMYRVVISNTCGTINSSAAMLTVWTTPVVTNNPGNASICEGTDHMFTANATGFPAPTVQWQVDDGNGFADIPGAVATSYTVVNATPSMNGYMYRAVFTNTCATVNSSAATLTVRPVPAITQQPTDQSECEGNNATFTANASGDPVPTAQWQVDDGNGWVDIPGETNTALNLNNVTAGMNGFMYRAIFTNECGVVTSSGATLTVWTAPVVTLHPTSQTICENNNVSFLADATGFPAPTVQWEVNDGNGWVALVGETNTTLNLNNVPASSNGNMYRAVFTNVCSSINSDEATLTVNTAPVVTLDPVPQNGCEGDTFVFTADASGDPAPTVQWQVDEGLGYNDIPGETNTTLTLNNVPASFDGNLYRAVFTNVCGSATTQGALLIIDVPAFVTQDPLNQTVCENDNATFMSDGDGTPAPTVQWQVDDGNGWVDIPGETNKDLNLNNVTAGMDGNMYRAVYTNACGTAMTQAAMLTVNTTPVVTMQPADVDNACEGDDVSFMSDATGQPAPTVQWQVDDGNGWVDLPGETNTTLNIMNVQGSQDGYMYRAVFTNICGTTNSDAALLLVDVPPSVTLQPVNTTVCQGETAFFTSTASGDPAPTIQWQCDDGNGFQDLPGKTQTTLDLTGVLPQWDGNMYRAVFTNPCGTSVPSDAAMLTVNTDPIVTVDPQDQTVCEGDNAMFTADASGQPTPTVQWQVDNGNGWADIPGEVNTTLNLNNVAANMDGNMYRAVFTNVCNSATTTPATLTVNVAPVVTASPADVSVCEGSQVTYSASATGTPAPTVQWQVNDGNGWVDMLGETGLMLTLSNIPANFNGNMYRAVFTNICGSATTLEATLTVWTEPTITMNPANDIVCEGEDAMFSATADGFPTPSVQWQVDDGNGWTNLAGETSTNLTIVNAQANMDGNLYRAVFMNNCGVVTSNTAMLTVNTAPVVTAQPQDDTVCQMETAEFTVEFTGQPTPMIQWQIFNQQSWADLSGENSPTLTLPNVPGGWDGNLYRAILTNVCGTVISQAATLRVMDPPVVLVQPNPQTVCEGANVTFTSSADGDPIPTIQWQVNDGNGWIDLPGETSQDLQLNGVTPAMDGNLYRAVFTNVCGTVESQQVALGVNSNPVITEQPQDTEVCEGTVVLLQANAIAKPPATLQWQVNDGNGWVDILGETTTLLNLGAVTAAMDGYQYRIEASNICDVVFSNAATLIVNEAPVVTLDPTDETICAGEDITFTAMASGQPTPEITWEINRNDGNGWVDYEQNADETLELEDVPAAWDGFQFRAMFVNVCGEDISEPAVLTVWTEPIVTMQPQDMLVCEPNDVTFTAAASGTPTPTVQWQVSDDQGNNWNDILGATMTDYTFTPTIADDGNWYRAIFTNACGVATTDAAELDYYLLPFITQQPTAPAEGICTGEDWTFTVVAGGTEISYQWRKDGVNIPGATSDSYTLSNIAVSDAGTYDVVITNVCQSITSDGAVLIVNTPPAITQQPVGDEICEGEDYTFTVVATGTGLMYQWQKYDDNNDIWVNINGETNSSLTLTNLVEGDEGDYRVNVSGVCPPDVNSDVATLIVNNPPMITEEPSIEGELCEFDELELTVGATGTLLEYQWYHNGMEIDGANGDTYNVASVTTGNAGVYYVIVSGLCEPEVQSTSVTVVVNLLPRVESHPVSLNGTSAICLDDPASFSVVASGTEIEYQWEYSENGVVWNPIAEATDATFSLANAQYSDAGFYRVVVTGICEPPAISDAAELVVHRPVELTIDVEDQTVCIGDNHIFVADGTGTPESGNENDELTYQWYKNGEMIPLANERQLILTNIEEADAGHYQVLIKGYCNSVWSSVAILFVTREPLAEIYEPRDLVVNPGEDIEFEINTNCPPGAVFQWYRGDEKLVDDGRITGANQSRLVIRDVLPTDASNNYYATVTCACGSVNTEFAALTVNPLEITITENPEDFEVCEGSEICLQFGYNSFGQPVTIQWFDAANNPVAGATTNPYCFVPTADETYYAEVRLQSNPAIVSNTGNARVTLLFAPIVATDPTDQAICPDGDATFTVVVSNTDPAPTYQWVFNGTDMAGETGASLSLTNVDAAMLGMYWAVVTNSCGTTTTAQAELSFLPETVITTQPQDQGYDYGGKMTTPFTVVAEGAGTCSYQWQFRADDTQAWADIVGAVSDSYDNNGNALTLDEAGEYRVIVTCDCGFATSDAATLDVGPTAVEDAQPGMPFSLSQNAPNPFDNMTQISYTLHKSMEIELIVTDVMGQVVATIDSGFKAAGHYEVSLNAEKLILPSGTYSYTLKGDGQALTKQLIIVK